MIVLEARNICKHFTNGTITNHVLEGLNLTLESGKMALLMGPSGAGKSTLLAALSGLQKPDGGEIYFDGINIWEKSDKEMCDYRLINCAFIFQEVNLFSCLSGIDQIRLVLEHGGANAEESYERAQSGLEEVGLGDKGHLMPPELSGGEKQRVAIARALAAGARMIFADEPTSNLDSNNGQHIVELLQMSAHEHGAIVLCATHDERVQKMADRIIYLEDGIIQKDTIKEDLK